MEVGGVNVKDIDPHVLMDRIAFVFQNTRLFKTSILENVRAARPDASREEVLAALRAAQCDDILDKLPQGVDTIIGSEGTYLSGGEQQRVALARAILKDAPIIVLDEATAFADPENEALIQKALKTLTRGRTVIMIAHRLSTVAGADQILVLDQGHIVEAGTHDALCTAGGLYERMWREYNQAVRWKIASGKVQGALSRLLRGKTVLVIAHRMRTVEAADKIVVLADGRVVEEGSPAELLAREDSVFRRMARLQTASAAWRI